MLIYRVLTALVLIPLTLTILFFTSPIVFLIATGVVVLGGAWEWSSLMGLRSKASRILYFLIVLFFMGWSLFIPLRYIYTLGLVWWVLALVLVLSYPTMSSVWGRGVYLRGLMGLFVLLPCWASLNTLRSLPSGAYDILFLFLLVWGADTFAYFTGKRWGKHKLCKEVSPGKSWQGLGGALLGTFIIALSFAYFAGIPSQTWHWLILLSLLTTLFSVLGDLLESMMKRQVGLKDSGRLLPGHGGLLDRIDSLTAAAPLFTVGVLMIGSYL